MWTSGSAPVDTDAERIGIADRGADLHARADPRCWDMLEERGRDAVPSRRNAREPAVEIAELDIGEREPLGIARRIVNDAQTGIDAIELACCIVGAAIAAVGKSAQARLYPAAFAGVEAQAQSEPALLVRCRAIYDTSLGLHDRDETVATTVASVDSDVPASDPCPSAR